ncbi:hypothetical protein ACT3CE_15605 [Marinifilum sp. RC60d5]|uniref:hypothetical protein n=1 Tax=Marinifilum sp. RC60d5 TaxID=3458414 RepID=UPI004036EA4A
MTDNTKENLEGIVSKLKEKGINAGESEKQRIIEEAKKQAEVIIAEAELLRKNILNDAKMKAEQVEGNSRKAIAQASRDMVEATKISILQHLKSVFGKQCEALFTQEQFLQELVKSVVSIISGNKTVAVPQDTIKAMESYLLKQLFSEQIVLKPLGDSSAKIIMDSTDKKGVQFVLSAQDVEEALFSLLNKDLVERITNNQEE